MVDKERAAVIGAAALEAGAARAVAPPATLERVEAELRRRLMVMTWIYDVLGLSVADSQPDDQYQSSHRDEEGPKKQ